MSNYINFKKTFFLIFCMFWSCGMSVLLSNVECAVIWCGVCCHPIWSVVIQCGACYHLMRSVLLSNVLAVVWCRACCYPTWGVLSSIMEHAVIQCGVCCCPVWSTLLSNVECAVMQRCVGAKVCRQGNVCTVSSSLWCADSRGACELARSQESIKWSLVGSLGRRKSKAFVHPWTSWRETSETRLWLKN